MAAAKAVAGEAGVPFLAFSASEFVELFVGEYQHHYVFGVLVLLIERGALLVV